MDYKILEEELYERLDKEGWKVFVMGEGLEVSIDVNTGVKAGVTYSVYLKEEAPVYWLYQIVLFTNRWGEEDSEAYEIGEYETVGKLLSKIRSLDREKKG